MKGRETNSSSRGGNRAHKKPKRIKRCSRDLRLVLFLERDATAKSGGVLELLRSGLQAEWSCDHRERDLVDCGHCH